MQSAYINFPFCITPVCPSSEQSQLCRGHLRDPAHSACWRTAVSSLPPALCSVQGPFTPPCSSRNRRHGNGTGLPSTLLQKGRLNTFVPSAVLQQEPQEKTPNQRPFRTHLFRNEFYVTPEFKGGAGCKEMGLRNSILPKTRSCRQSPCAASQLRWFFSVNQETHVVQGNVGWGIILQPSPLSYLRMKLLLVGGQGRHI